MHVDNAALAIDNNVALEEASRSTGSAGNQIAEPIQNQPEAGLSASLEANTDSAEMTATASTSVAAANDASVEGLPAGMTQAEFDKAVDYAKLSSQVYDWDDYATAEAGMALFKGIGDIRNQDFSTPNYREVGGNVGNAIDWWGGRDQGLDYTVFENTETGDLVVSYRGSEPLSAEDWVEDAEQVFGDSEQYEQAVNMARDLAAQVDAYNAANGTDKQLSFTGHSLGGGLATASALATGKEAIVFDAAGLSQGTIDQNNLDVSHADKITNFNVQGSFVTDANGRQDDETIGSGLGGIVPETKQYGEAHWLQGVNKQADFGGWLIPDWTNTAKLAESVLNHAWHVFTHQLENKQFLA
ncbi:MAG: hypothetical protein R3183_10955 [Oleiphilaceae bacterium]|nr:hypothetical protein [Oleiphilaceae bacterium]